MALRRTMMMTMIAASLAAGAGLALAHGGHGPGEHCAGAAGAPMANCPAGMPGGMGMRGGMRGPEAATARLAAVKDALKLQPAQTAAWDAYEATLRSTAEARARLREGMLERRGNADAMAEYRVTMSRFNAQAAEEMLAARKAFVAALTPEQKATFDTFGPGMGTTAGGRSMKRGGTQGGPGCRGETTPA